MPHSGENIRFQISVNGEVQATAGLESFGVLTLIVDWVRRDRTRMTKAIEDDLIPPDLDPEEWAGGNVEARIGGLDSVSKTSWDWWKAELKPGDEFTFRVLGPGEFDQPKERPRAEE